MNNQKSWKSFLAGMLTMAMIFALGIPALAAAGKNVTIYPGVNIYVDDQKINPKDANGNPVEVFIYNGSTYLPVRAVSEALGKPVQWEGSTTSVYVGKHTGDKPAVWLSDLDYYNKTNEWYINKGNADAAKDNVGNTHTHFLSPTDRYGHSITYKLNGQYSRLTGMFYQQFRYRAEDGECELSIYGDGELLWSGIMNAGIDPIEFDVNVKGVLQVELKTQGGWNNHHIALGEVGLWT